MTPVFEGRLAVVTGASRGIGCAIAEALAGAGARVVGTYTGRSDAPLSAACEQWIAADFAQPEDIESCALALTELRPDILINNAGINVVAPFSAIDPADFRRIQQVNLFAPFRLCQAVTPAMQARGWGRIVNVSSIWGKISRTGRASYSASKFGLDGLTVALAAEYASAGVLANSVAPGFIDTELTRQTNGPAALAALVAGVPAARLGEPAEIAKLVVWLASPENTFVTGQNIAIDGGFTRV